MSTKEKLKKRFKTLPRDFTFDESLRLLTMFGFTMDNKGATSGSRVEFRKGKSKIILHKPHPGNIMKPAVMKMLYAELKDLKLL